MVAVDAGSIQSKVGWHVPEVSSQFFIHQMKWANFFSDFFVMTTPYADVIYHCIITKLTEKQGCSEYKE